MEMLRVGRATEQEYEIVAPRFKAVRESIHAQWEDSSDEMSAELKRLLRAVKMLERLFTSDIDGMRIAEDKLGIEK